MTPYLLWNIARHELERQHGHGALPLDAYDRVHFDLFGLDATEYWVNYNIRGFDIQLGVVLVRVHRFGRQPPYWHDCDPSDSALIDLTLRVGLIK